MKKVNRFISMLLLIFMVLTMDLNGYSQIVKAATTNLVEKEASENLIITSFTADKKSPQATGTQVTLTAKATGEGTLQYKFLIKDLSTGNWYKLRDFSTSNTYVWKTGAVGNKMLYVDVKDVNENVVRKEMSYVVKEKLTELAVTSFTADKQSPQVTGTKITLTAEATGEGTLQYKFLIKDTSGNWYKLRDFSTSNTYIWTTGAIGNKTLYVDVKDSSENVVRKEMSYVVKEKTTTELKITRFTADKQSPQIKGTLLRLSAEATGEGELQYKFILKDSNGNWYAIRDFANDNTANWISNLTGNISLYVDVKDASEKVVRKELKFVINEAEITRERIPMENTIVSRTITEPTEIYWNGYNTESFKVSDKLESYKLEYIKREDDINLKNEKYITIDEGSNIKKGDILGTFDTTLLQNGLYKIRLTATDINGVNFSMSAIYLVSGNMKAGNFSLSYEDLNIPLDGLPITVVRNYDSRNKSSGDFGNGWSLALSDLKLEITANIGQDGWIQKQDNFKYTIEQTKEHKVTITYPTGEVEEFDVGLEPNEQQILPIEYVKMYFTTKNNSKAKLKSLEDLSFYTKGLGKIELLDSKGDCEPTLFEFTDKNGIKYIINKNTGVEKITYLDGDYVTINKTGLVYTSADGSKTKEVKITRDSQGRISSISDFDGKTINYGYDDKGNLTKVTDREGRETNYEYDSDKLSKIKSFGGYFPAKYEYDNNGRMIAYTDEYRVKTEFNFDEGAKQYVVKDALGNVEIYEYDSQGNITSYTDKENNKTLYEYDENNKLSKETNPLGNVFLYKYDTDGNLLSKEDSYGNKVEATYNRFGQAVTIKDANSSILTNTYNNSGLLTQIKDPNDNTVNVQYTSNEKPEIITNQLGKTTKFTYDENNNLKTMTDEAGNVTNFEYDKLGRCEKKSIEVTNGDKKEIVTVSYKYDEFDNITKATDSKGNVTTYTYKDKTNELTQSVDRNGNITKYEYDNYGNLSKIIYPDNTTEEFTYDKLRNVLSSTDGNKNITYYKYDKMSRLTYVKYPNGLEVNYTYDKAGNLIKIKDSTNQETNYTYDKAGRNTEITDSLGNKTIFEYTSTGKVSKVIDAKGNSVEYKYDNLGRKTKIISGTKTLLSCEYDALGRVTSQTDGENNKTTYSYDEVGNLIGVTNPLNQKTSYKYNEIGNLIEETDANGNATKYAYDNLGRVVSRTLPLGQKESYK